jgi:methyltransferase-like protein 6
VNTVFLKNVHTAETAAAGTKRGHATPDQAPPGCPQRTACLLPPAAGHDRAVEPRAPGLRRTERAASLVPEFSACTKMHVTAPCSLPRRQDAKDAPVVHFHASRDFDWDELRERAEPTLRAQQQRAVEAEAAGNSTRGAGAVDTAGQIAGWERHFCRHKEAPTPFFKERRALLEEFPLLKEPGIRILEVGCGNGSNVLPLLRHNPSATVHATDPSPTAVEDTRRRLYEAGLSGRLTTEVQPTATVPCSPEHRESFDVVMVLCTLSAIPGNDDAALLNATAAFLKPGGAVLIRDHGLYDMRHLRDMQRDAWLCDHIRPAYVRPGGMHRRYYSLPNLDALAAGAGLQVEESRYLCIRQRNQKKEINMDRVYVHAVFRREKEAAREVARERSGATCDAGSGRLRPLPLMEEPADGREPRGHPAAAAYVNAIRSCGADSSAALEILQEMTSTFGSSDMFAVSTALAVCGKGGNWRKAMELFDSIPQACILKSIIYSDCI